MYMIEIYEENGLIITYDAAFPMMMQIIYVE